MLRHEDYRKLIPQEEVILTKNYKLEIKLPILGPKVWNLDSLSDTPESDIFKNQYIVRSVDWMNEQNFNEICEFYNLFSGNAQKLQLKKYKDLFTQIENFGFTNAIQTVKELKNELKNIKLTSLNWMMDILIHDLTNFLWIDESNCPLIQKKLNDFIEPKQTYWGALISGTPITVGTKSNSFLDNIAEVTKRNFVTFNPLDFQTLLRDYQDEKILNFIIKVCRIRCFQAIGQQMEALKRVNELPKVFPKNKTVLNITQYVKSLLNETYAPEDFKASSPITSLMEVFPHQHTICGWLSGNVASPKQIFKTKVPHFDLTKSKFTQAKANQPSGIEIVLDDLSKSLIFKNSEFSYENKPLLYKFIKTILLKKSISLTELVAELQIDNKQSTVVIDNLFSRVKSDFLGLIQNKNNVFEASSRPTYIIETNIGFN